MNQNKTEISLFIELRSTGLSLEKISQKLNVSKPTLIKWSKDHKIEIENLRAISHEHILNHFKLSREAHLERIAKIYSKGITELETRDLSSLPIDKLLKVIGELREVMYPMLENKLKLEKDFFEFRSSEYDEVTI